MHYVIDLVDKDGLTVEHLRTDSLVSLASLMAGDYWLSDGDVLTVKATA